jgi:hypothetical protein
MESGLIAEKGKGATAETLRKALPSPTPVKPPSEAVPKAQVAKQPWEMTREDIVPTTEKPEGKWIAELYEPGYRHMKKPEKGKPGEGGFVGGIYKIGDDRYVVYDVEDGRVKGRLPGEFKNADFEKVGTLQLSATRSVSEYRFKTPAQVSKMEGEKAPPMSQAGGIATEKISPNLYIGNVTPGMKRRIAESGQFNPKDIQGFKEEGFPTKRTKIEMTRQEAGNYLTWAIGAIDNIIQQVEQQGVVTLTMNQLAMTQALIGDIKALQDALGYEVKPAQITFKQAKKPQKLVTGPPQVSTERFNEIVEKVKQGEELTEDEQADLTVALRQEQAIAKARKLTTKQVIEAKVQPGKQEKVTKTTYEIFKDIMKNVSKASERAYVAAGRDMVKQHKNLAVVAKETLDKAEATPGEVNRLMGAVARARTEREQILAMASVQAIAEKAKKRSLGKRISQSIPDSVDFFYREAIEALREGIDPHARSKKTLERRRRTREFLARDPEKLKDIPIKLIKKLNQASLGEMSIEELTEIADAIDKLIEQGKLKRKLSLVQKQRRFTEKKEAMLEGITKGEPIEIDKGPKVFSTTKTGLVKTAMQKARAWNLRPARIFDKLDGGKNFAGPAHTFFVDKTNSLTDAKWRKTDARLDAGKAKQEELGITSNILSETRVINGVRYRVDEMIDIYAKNKNPLAKLALLYGNNLTEADIDAVISELTENEKAWGDYIIQDYDENYSRLRGTVIEVENRDMGSEENYTPIRRTEIDYSTHTEEIVDAILQKEGLRRAYAEKGFTIPRKNIPPEFQKPIRLGITQMWLAHVAKQEQYIHLAQHIKDMHRMRESKDFVKAVTAKFGNEYNKVIKGYVNRVADPNIYRTFDSLENLSRHLRQNAAIAYLSYNLVTMAKQLPSSLLYLQDSGLTHWLSSVAEFTANPMKLVQKVRDLDPQVKHKAIERELEELRKAHGKTTTQLIRRFGDVGMQGIYLFDTVARTIGWNAVYNKALADGKSEAEAIRLAQNATLRTQPAAAAKDLPELYATSEFAHWFTMFTNQLNQIYNIATYDVPSYIKNQQYGSAALASVGMATMALTIWMLTHKDVPDEPEDFMEAAGEQAINSVPLVGRAIMAGRRGWGDSGIPAFESSEAVGRSLAAIERGEFTEYDIKTIIEGFAVSAGVPYIGPKRAIEAVRTGQPTVFLGGKTNTKPKPYESKTRNR